MSRIGLKSQKYKFTIFKLLDFLMAKNQDICGSNMKFKNCKHFYSLKYL